MNEKHVIRCVIKLFKNFFSRYVIIAMLCLFNMVSAQNSDGKITGIILDDSSGQPLIGVNIVLKDTKQGAVTDFDGNFSINAKMGGTLTISYVGYENQEVKITSNKLTIRLKEQISTLDEVVVIGYGKAKRGDLTGAISSISGEELRKTQPVTFDQALQGKVPGVVVQQTSGQPGGGVNVQIRGLSSFGSSSPMYVIDGVIIGEGYAGVDGSNPLAAINPSDIESIDVLKDASATAIYGSQATNGVIVITTKRGKEGPPKITYSYSGGFQQLTKQYPTMNLQEYAAFINARNEGIGWGFDARPELANPKYLGEGTNWQDELFRSAPMSNHALTVSGGNDRTNYLMSGSFFKQEGIALGSDFNRASLRINLDNKTTDWLKIGTSLQLTHIDENLNSTSTGVISQALSQTPDIPVKNADGSYAGVENQAGWVAALVNPFALALINKNEQKRNELYANFYTEIAFTKDLTFRNELSGSYSFRTQDKFNPTYEFGKKVETTNSARYDYNQNYRTTFRSFLTYTKVFGSKYNVNVLAGHEAQLSQNESVWAARNNFVSNSVTNISSGDPETDSNGGSKGDGAQESYFGRLILGFFDKYLITGNVRADGSSNFAPSNRWVTTYSGAFSWKLNKENFLKDSKIVNELKLRVGYGFTNNQNVSNNAYLSLLKLNPTALAGNALSTANLANPDVEWEKTEYSNAGVDVRLFNWRLNLTVDAYNRLTDGLLMKIPLPWYSGTSTGSYPAGLILSPDVNIGSIRNRGFDIGLNTTNVQTKDFTWKTDFTLSHNENKVMKLNTDGASLHGWGVGSNATNTVVGRSIGEFYGYRVDGVFATADDFFDTNTVGANGNTHTHGMPTNTDGNLLPVTPNSGGVWYGDLKFKDLNGDGVITEKDQTFLGSPIPKFQIGFGNSINYKGLDFNIFFSANVGNKVLNGMRVNGDNPLASFGYLKSLNDYAKIATIDPNGAADDINNFYVTNPETTIVGVRNNDSNRNNRFSDRYLEDGSFIRCKNITLGYTFPEDVVKKIHLNSLRVYANVSNAFLITKYKGLDPEVGSWNPLSAGIDSGFYPQPRIFTLGLNIGLTK